jgi:uncharacterized protein YjbJ (UPF0337 family)
MKGNPAAPGSPLTSKPTWSNTRGVFSHVGFFFARFSQQLLAGVTIMSGKTDVVKGRIKEAAGALTGNNKLRTEGNTDQAVGKVKQVAEKAVDKVEQAVKKVRK